MRLVELEAKGNRDRQVDLGPADEINVKSSESSMFFVV